MARAYSMDLRERVVAAVSGGLSRRQAAARFGVSYSVAIYWLKRLRETGSVAPWLLTRPINGQRFRIYVEKVLVPTLSPGDIFIMDNLGAHKSSAVRQAIRPAGAKLILLPKYSPDLNPIEKLFAKIKHHLREAQARTRDAVSHAIATALETIKPKECKNYFTSAGYERI
jgi:putative transposase